MNLKDVTMLNRKLRGVILLASSASGKQISSGQVTIFEDLHKYSPTTVQDITGRTKLAQSYVSKTIALMKKEGVVKIRQSRTDRRKIMITFNQELAGYVQSMSQHSIHEALVESLPSKSSADILRVEALLAELTRLFME
jgi:DNA-binding MarR family transcriptional regulator